MRRALAVVALGLAAIVPACRAPESSPPMELLGTTYLVFAPEGEEELTSPVTVGGELRPALVAPMPAEFRHRLQVPERATLTFAMGIALAPGVPASVADGARVRFTIKGGEELPDAVLFDRELDASRRDEWVPGVAELDRFSGKEIWLVFQAVLAESDGSQAPPVVGVFGDPILHDRARYGKARGVVVITVDGLARDRTSLDGYERRTTPGLEALAEDAVVFDERPGPSPVTHDLPLLFRDAGFFTAAILPHEDKGTSAYHRLARPSDSSAADVTDRAIELLHARGDGDLFLRVRYDELVADRELPVSYRTAFGSGEVGGDAKLLYLDREIRATHS